MEPELLARIAGRCVAKNVEQMALELGQNVGACNISLDKVRGRPNR